MSKRDNNIRVFITHTSDDRAKARQLRNWLVHHPGVSTFTVDDLSAGGNWQEKLREQIATSNLILFIASPDSLDSSFVLQELGAAWAFEKPIITVLTSRASAVDLPFRLEEQLTMDLEEFSDPDAVRDLIGQYREPAST